METLIVTTGEQHPTDVADLRGKRLAIATETEEGRRLAESKVKQLTGGDRLRARYMRRDFFEFDPTHKLLIVGNHRPVLRNVDEAIKRRLLLVPFTATIPPEKRDPDLSVKLQAERPAILGWMLDGCLEWQRDGLNPAALRPGRDRRLLRDRRRVRALGRGLPRLRPERHHAEGDGVRLVEGMGRGARRVHRDRGPAPRLPHRPAGGRRDPDREGAGPGVDRRRAPGRREGRPVRRTGRTPAPVPGVHARAHVNGDIPKDCPPRPPAGHFALSALYPHVTGAGASLACGACEAREMAPLPRDVGAYNQAVEGFIRRHATCAFRPDPLGTRS